MVPRAVTASLALGLLLMAAALPAGAAVADKCRNIDVSSLRFSPDQQSYDVGALVTVRAVLKNYDTTDYNLTLYTILNNPTWSTTADGTPCGPAPQPTTSSCAFDTNILADPTGRAPVLNLRQRDVLISTGSDNNTSAVTTKGPMPTDVVVQVTGEVPSISVQEERSFLRIRQERGGVELCTAAAETRQITSAVLGHIEQCFQDADSAVTKTQRFMDRDARDAGLKSSDLANEQSLMDQASKDLQRAKDDYAKLRAGTENQSILDNCNDAIRLAQQVEVSVKEKMGGAGFSSFITGTVVPVVVIIVVVILALMFLGKKRWDRL